MCEYKQEAYLANLHTVIVRELSLSVPCFSVNVLQFTEQTNKQVEQPNTLNKQLLAVKASNLIAHLNKKGKQAFERLSF